jgi:hypothetical protein
MKKLYATLIITLGFSSVFSQIYPLLGTAFPLDTGCNCYQLTDIISNEAGAVFDTPTINLYDSLDLTFANFFGCGNGAGGEGEVFELTATPLSLGNTGLAMGYGSRTDTLSLAIEFDTHQDTSVGDPGYHHTAIDSGGFVTHNVAAPVPALPNSGNIDDCNWHSVRIVWSPSAQTLYDYFDGNLRISQHLPNLVNRYFKGNPMVSYKWTGSTGIDSSVQLVCFLKTCDTATAINKIPSSAVQVFPNPTGDWLRINTVSMPPGLSFALYNMAGQLVATRKLESPDEVIDLRQLANGLYLYQINGLAPDMDNRGKLQILR